MNALQRALDLDLLGRARELLNRQRPAAGQVDLRGWEWRYFWQFCQGDAQSVLKLPEDGSDILSVAASSDGKWAAIGHSSGSRPASIFYLPSGEVSQVPDTEGRARLAFSPREPLLAIATSGRGSADPDAPFRHRILLWDVNSRQVVRTWNLPGYCSGLSFSADGELLIAGNGVSGRPIGEICVWRVSDGVKLASWPAGIHSTGTGRALFAATADGSAAAVVTKPRTLSVVDLKTGEQRWTAATDDSVMCLAFSPDGRVLVSGAGYVDSVIRIWDVVTGSEIGRLEGHRGWVSRLEFLADGKRLVSSSADQTLRVWDLATRRSLRTLRGHETELHGFALLPDQRTLVSGCKDGSVFVWNLERDASRQSSGTFKAAPGGWVLEGDGNTVVTVDSSGRVIRRHGRAFEEESVLLEIGAVATDNPIAGGVVMDRSRPLLAARSADGKLKVWDWAQRTLVREWDARAGSARIEPYAFAANGTKVMVLALESPRSSLREWDLASGRESRKLEFPVRIDAGSRIFHSPDESRLVGLTNQPERALVMDLRTGNTSFFDLNIRQAGYGPTFSPDGRLVVLPSWRGYARVLESTGFQEVTTLGGYMFGVHSAGFSPDIKRLAIFSTGWEALTLWDVHTYERLLTLAAPAGVFARMRFSKDGNVIAGQSIGDGTVHFWRAPSWAEIEAAERSKDVKASQ
jgi:WD40 repeat protein